jgi:ADP-dependent phosphofructokinase/glucokinase
MNEDEMQAILGRPLDLLDADRMAGALRELAGLVPAPTVVVHSGAWCLAVGPHAAAYRSALTAAVALAGTRYLLGDEYTRDDVDRVRALPGRPAGRAFADEVEALLPGEVACVPVHLLETATPTTIGLGDTFIGGLVAALAQQHPRRSSQ